MATDKVEDEALEQLTLQCEELITSGVSLKRAIELLKEAWIEALREMIRFAEMD